MVRVDENGVTIHGVVRAVPVYVALTADELVRRIVASVAGRIDRPYLDVTRAYVGARHVQGEL